MDNYTQYERDYKLHIYKLVMVSETKQIMLENKQEILQKIILDEIFP